MSPWISLLGSFIAAGMVIRIATVRRYFRGDMYLVEFLVRVVAIIVLLELSVWIGGTSVFLQSVLAMVALAGVLTIVWAVRQERAPDDVHQLTGDRTWRSG